MRINHQAIFIAIAPAMGTIVSQSESASTTQPGSPCVCLASKSCDTTSTCYLNYVDEKTKVKTRKIKQPTGKPATTNSGKSFRTTTQSVARAVPVFESSGPVYEAVATTVSHPCYTTPITKCNQVPAVQAPVTEQVSPATIITSTTTVPAVQAPAVEQVSPVQIQYQMPVVKTVTVPITPRLTWSQKRKLRKAAIQAAGGDAPTWRERRQMRKDRRDAEKACKTVQCQQVGIQQPSQTELQYVI